jgi:hypothetical protein
LADTFALQSRTLLVGSLGNWAGTVLTWNIVLDAAGGPHVGGCETCIGVVTAGTDAGFPETPGTTRPPMRRDSSLAGRRR